MERRFENKVVLVTGGTSGIGLATARRLAEEGALVIACARNIDQVKNVHQVPGVWSNKVASSQNIQFIQCDVSKKTDVQRMFQEIKQKYGRLDCAFNNAGIEENIPFMHCTETDYSRVFDINVKGVFLCMQEEIKLMRENIAPSTSFRKGGQVLCWKDDLCQSGTVTRVDPLTILIENQAFGRYHWYWDNIQNSKDARKTVGSIVNMASVTGLTPGLVAIYGATKHAIVGLTKGVAREVAPAVRINAICPGPTHTPLVDRVLETVGGEATATALANMIPKQRMGKPEDSAKVVSFLLSEDADYMYGSTVVVDGGFICKL